MVSFYMQEERMSIVLSNHSSSCHVNFSVEILSEAGFFLGGGIH